MPQLLSAFIIAVLAFLTYYTLSPSHLAPSLSLSMSSGPSKRGLCWPVEESSPTVPFTRPGSKVSWLYNWSPNPTRDSSIPFIPMQWNGANAHELRDKCSASASASAPAPAALLAFNEPERADQANMTPAAAASIWLEHMQPLRAQGVRAGSPGISSCEEGIAWLLEFTKIIREAGSNVDFWCLHWYGEGLGAFYDFIWSTHHRLDAGIPVWITEFACTNWQQASPLGREAVEGFMRESIAYLDTLDWVERYAWFGPMKDTGTVGRWAALLDADGEISELGKLYRDL